MNPLHLVWIIPFAGSIGFLMGALMRVGEVNMKAPSDRVVLFSLKE